MDLIFVPRFSYLETFYHLNLLSNFRMNNVGLNSVYINSLRTDGDFCHQTDGDFCHQGRDTEIAQKNLRLLKPTDMTIHWKALEEHFLMVPLLSDGTIIF
jgi:hypothetical protein